VTPARAFLLACVVCLGLLAGRWAFTGNFAGGDAVYYYVTLRSLVVDRDLRFENEYLHFTRQRSAFTGRTKLQEVPPAHPATGRPPNKYPVGTALLLAPFFAVAHTLALALSTAGLPVVPDGYGPMYQWTAAIGSASWGALAIVLMYLATQRIVSRESAFPAAAAAWFATPLVYYMSMEPLMSHAASAACVSALTYFWISNRERHGRRLWLLTGMAGGVAAIVRYQDALFIALPAADALFTIVARTRQVSLPVRRADGDARTGRIVGGMLLFAVAAAGMISIQLAANTILHGSPFAGAYRDEGFTNVTQPRLLATLFSPHSGLFLWSPILVAGLVGLVWPGEPHRRTRLLLLAGFVAQWYLISSWSSPLQGDSFGGRMFVACLPAFSIGLGAFFERVAGGARFARLPWGLVTAGSALTAVLAGLYVFRVIGEPY
jgi:hypothetical protein